MMVGMELTEATTQELRELVFSVARTAAPDISRAQFERAWEEALHDAMQLGLEVLKVERRGLSYAAAANHLGGWILLPRVHFGIFDLLQFEIPRHAHDGLRAYFEMARSLDEEGVGQELLFLLARGTGVLSACVRYLLYTAVRVNLWLITWHAPKVEAIGAMADLDVRAEDLIRKRLADATSYAAEVRPFTLVVAEALLELGKAIEQREESLVGVCIEERKHLATVTKLAAAARAYTAGDAAITRNTYAGSLSNGERLPAAMLTQRHPLSLTSEGATNVRKSRLRPPSASVVRCVDLVREVYGDKGVLS